MSMVMQRGYFGAEALTVASEAFSRAWNFIERDPIFESYDREKLQTELARVVFEMLETGERNLLHIANGAIRCLRERNASTRAA